MDKEQIFRVGGVSEREEKFVEVCVKVGSTLENTRQWLKELRGGEATERENHGDMYRDLLDCGSRNDAKKIVMEYSHKVWDLPDTLESAFVRHDWVDAVLWAWDIA